MVDVWTIANYFRILLKGVFLTLQISIYAFVLGALIGIPMALAAVYGGFLLKTTVSGYEKLFRGVPVIIIMMIFYFGVGIQIPILRNAFVSATFSLALRSGAYQAQIFKGAMRGVKETQMMAARSIGMTEVQAFRYVMLPQMLLIAVSGMGSEYALLVKDSAYAYIIGVAGDIMYYADQLKAYTWGYLSYFPAAILYISLTFPLATFLDRWGSKQKKKFGV